MKPKAVVSLLLAASVVVSLWVAGPFSTVGFILRSPIILMNDLISIIRHALVPSGAVETTLPPALVSGTGSVRLPVSTTGLAASLQVSEPSQRTTSATPQPSPAPAPVSPPEGLVPPPDGVLAPVEEILKPAEPLLDPVQNAVDPVVDSATSALEPVIDPVENAVGPVTDPVEKALEPVKDTIGGSGGGNTPDAGGAVNDVKNALEKIGLP